VWSGSLSLDDIRRAKLPTKRELERELNISLAQPTIIVLYHPVTLLKNTIEEAAELFKALQTLEQQILFIYPNADAGCRELIHLIRRFVSAHSKAKAFVNLDHRTFLSLLRNVDLLIGNSSGGIIESTPLGVPAIDIGIRQRGREHAANVLRVPAKASRILRAVEQALDPSFRDSIQGLKSPYGDGRASDRIVRELATTPLGPKLLFKS
jgi:UDP-N-acetylglucosamine 2-epimerase (non-hydrolysing)/GDP/UDP-N,N'-diacetylbacillosamine 2-epimerase (hydrolysing)